MIKPILQLVFINLHGTNKKSESGNLKVQENSGESTLVLYVNKLQVNDKIEFKIISQRFDQMENPV